MEDGPGSISDNRLVCHMDRVLRSVNIGWDAMTEKDRNGMESWLRVNSDRFCSEFNPLQRTSTEEHRIRLAPEAKPVSCPPRRRHPELEQYVKETVDRLLKEGHIRPSTSPWASDVVLTKKKDGSYRFAIDYRRLNDVTVMDAHPIPRVDDALAAMAGARYFSVFDMASGYWQVPVAEEDRYKTAFVTREGLFEWNSMPFGLKSAPATYCRLMNKLLTGLNYIDCLVYMDDVIVFSSSLKEHFDRFDRVFTRLKEHNVMVNPMKTHLLQEVVTYLGHLVGVEGIRPDKRLVQAVENYPVPADKKQLKAFLGLAGYYHSFIQDFAVIAAPLTDRIRKQAEWHWGEEQQQAFQELRRRLAARPVLAHPDFGRPFIVQADYSHAGFGAVLSQRSDDGEEHPVAYLSRKCRGRERHYSARRREAVAIRLALRRWRCFLEGRPFIIETDHRPLEFLRKETDDAQLCRIWEEMEPFSYMIRYRPGEKM